MLRDPVRYAIRYAITDRSQLGSSEPERRSALRTLADRWAAAGIDFIQLREKDLPAHELLQLCRQLRSVLVAQGSRTRLLLNSGQDLPRAVEIARAAQLDGLHLTSSWLMQFRSQSGDPSPTIPTPAELRARFPTSQSVTISVSCHSIAEVAATAASGVDLILFGPIFGKSIRIPDSPAPDNPESTYRTVTPPTGLDPLRSACILAGQTPVLALGGITPANTALCLQAGAAGIAGIRLFQQPDATVAAVPQPAPNP